MSKQEYLFDPGQPVWCSFVGFDVTIEDPDDRRRALQLAMLETLINGDIQQMVVTVDDVVRSVDEPWPDGGRWAGPAIRELADDGLIVASGAVNSKRKSRHSGLTHSWTLGNSQAAEIRARLLRSALRLAPPDKSDSAAATAESQDSNSTTTKDKQSNG